MKYRVVVKETVLKTYFIETDYEEDAKKIGEDLAYRENEHNLDFVSAEVWDVTPE